MAQVSIKRKGYGQVEPNHLSAQYTGQIYAQLPAMVTTGSGESAVTTPIAQLENGQFLKYDYANGQANTTGAGEWMLVFNEVKLYDERRQRYKDFAMLADDMADKTIYPRLLKINIGDLFTTNTFGAPATGPDAEQATAVTLQEGDFVSISADGWLTKVAQRPNSGMAFQVAEGYDLADKQKAVKLQRIQ